MGEWFKRKFEPQMNRTEEYVNEIIKELNEVSDGKVKGEFKSIHSNSFIIKKNLDKIILKAQSSFVNFNNKGDDIEVDKNLLNKKDMNDYLNKDFYKFEIFNSCFHFRVFKVSCSETFPVTVELDEGISEELHLEKNECVVNSNENMRNFLKEIISTQKLNNIINQMMLQTDLEDDNKILDTIKTYGELNIEDISSKIGWTQRVTEKKLKKLLEEEKICTDDNVLFRLKDY